MSLGSEQRLSNQVFLLFALPVPISTLALQLRDKIALLLLERHFGLEQGSVDVTSDVMLSRIIALIEATETSQETDYDTLACLVDLVDMVVTNVVRASLT